jgi:hypothetical protein
MRGVDCTVKIRSKWRSESEREAQMPILLGTTKVRPNHLIFTCRQISEDRSMSGVGR